MREPDATYWEAKVVDLDPLHNAEHRAAFVSIAADWASCRFERKTGLKLNKYISRRDCYWIANRMIRAGRTPPVIRSPAILACATQAIELCALQMHHETEGS